MSFDALDVVRFARRIILDGGDPHPCERGAFCPYCCIAIAKGDLDDMHEVPQPSLEFVLSDLRNDGFTEIPTDAPLIQARKLLARRDSGIIHTKESALKLLDEIIEEREPNAPS